MILDISCLDDATRPTVPTLEGVTRSQRRAGEHLKQVHDHLRDNMQTIETLIERAAAGAVGQAQIAEETASLAMVANFRRFGNLRIELHLAPTRRHDGEAAIVNGHGGRVVVASRGQGGEEQKGAAERD